MDESNRGRIRNQVRLVGYIEGVSFLVLLLVAMPLKYFAGQPNAVSIVGAAHGFLWIAYLLVLVLAWRALRWPIKTAFLGVVASVVPLGPWWFESYLRRSDRAQD